LFAVEYRAIDKEHRDYAEQQTLARDEERKSFDKLLDKQQAGVQSILDQQDKNVRGILDQEQKHFERTLGNLVSAHRQEANDFAKLLMQEHELFNQQSNTMEFLTGKLIPASDPSPSTNPSCGVKPDDTVVFVGDEAYIASSFPHTVLRVNGDRVIAIDKLATGALVLTINIKAADGRIIMRLDEHGPLIPVVGLFMLRPDPSTLVIEDQFGNDLLNIATFLPDQINTSIWPNYSGGIRSQLLSTFKFFGLVKEDGSYTPDLKRLADDREGRPALLREIMKRSYVELLKNDLSKATPSGFDAELRKYGQEGDTHRKVMAFFLSAAKFSGIPLSPLIVKRGGMTVTRNKRPVNFKSKDNGGQVSRETPPPPPLSAPMRTIQLDNGITVSLSASADSFQMTSADRKWVNSLLELFEEYEMEHAEEQEGTEEGEEQN
jgi:hypothetical protein